jgi:hypothetical protein
MSPTGTTGVCDYRPQTSRRTPGSGDHVQRDSKGPYSNLSHFEAAVLFTIFTSVVMGVVTKRIDRLH